MDAHTQTVYVQLLNEGTVCYRPVLATHYTGATYLLHGQDIHCPDDEEWEFLPGTIVNVEHRTFDEVSVLVAVGKR